MPRTIHGEKEICESVFEDITEDALDVASESGDYDYWENVKDFWSKVKNKPVNSLSDRQYDWLEKINEDCADC